MLSVSVVFYYNINTGNRFDGVTIFIWNSCLYETLLRHSIFSCGLLRWFSRRTCRPASLHGNYLYSFRGMPCPRIDRLSASQEGLFNDCRLLDWFLLLRSTLESKHRLYFNELPVHAMLRTPSSLQPYDLVQCYWTYLSLLLPFPDQLGYIRWVGHWPDFHDELCQTPHDVSQLW